MSALSGKVFPALNLCFLLTIFGEKKKEILLGKSGHKTVYQNHVLEKVLELIFAFFSPRVIALGVYTEGTCYFFCSPMS